MTEKLQDVDAGTDYVEPVRRLLTLGEIRVRNASEWPDYVAKFGLGQADIPALIRLSADPELIRADSESREVWAPVHAWRALGQLRAAEAVPRLLAFLKTAEDDDAATVDLPIVFGMIGPAALAHLDAFIADRSNPTFAAATAMSGVAKIAQGYPEKREECIAILARTLEPDDDIDPSARGFAVADLLDLGAVEAIEPMREAFRRNLVNKSIAGDIEDVEIELGLRKRRSTPRSMNLDIPPRESPRPGADSPLSATPAPARSDKVGRNEPCPCGSGKKYKKCCLR